MGVVYTPQQGANVLADILRKVREIAPDVVGVGVNQWDDRDSWRADFPDGVSATPEQSTAIVGVFGGFVLPEPVPTITRRQCRLWLLQAGKTREDVETAIAAIPDPTAREAARIEWEDATTFHHGHPLMVALAPALDIDPATLPDAFRAAALL